MLNLLKALVYPFPSPAEREGTGLRKLLKTTMISLCFVLLLLSLNRKVFAATGINKQISFQGKVVNTNGTNVTSSNYDFEFKLYTVGTGGTAIWTETRTTTNQVTVTDGVFQVNLGSVTALPGSVDFNTDNIYLGVNFNNNSEMEPRIRFTAVPYAFNAEKVAGLTVTDTTGTLTIPNGKTISFADAFTTSGAFALTLTTTATTNATIPSGTITLVDLASSQTLTTKTIGSTGLVFSGATTDIDTAAAEGLTLQGRAASTFTTTAGNIILQPAGVGTTATVQIGAGGAGSTTPDFLGLDVKSNTGDPAGGFEGAMYYNTLDNKFRCYQNVAWTDCIGTGGSGPWTDDTGFTYLTDTAENLILGASTVAAASFFMNVSAGGLYLGTNEVLSGGLTFYSSGVGKTDPTIAANSAGDLTLSAPSGKVVVGAGSGNIHAALTGETDVLLADKIVTLTGAYSSTDFTFNRVFTGGAFGQDGTVFLITDTSGGGGTINPDMLVVNSALSIGGTFTGNLLRLQVNSSDKFVVDSNGNVGIGTTGPTTKLQVAGVVAPSANNAHTLGDAPLRWSNVYSVLGDFSSNVIVGNGAATAELSLKDANTFLYRDTGYATFETDQASLYLAAVTSITLFAGGTAHYVASATAFKPYTNNAYTLGAADPLRWSNVYSVLGNFSGAITGVSLRPASDSTTALQLQNAAGTSVLNVDTTNGNVGIGTTVPAYKLHVVGIGLVSSTFGVGATDPAYLFNVNGNGNIVGTLNVGVGITSPLADLGSIRIGASNMGLSNDTDLLTFYNSALTINGDLTISGATTDITTAATENLTLTAGTTGDVIVSGDADTNFQVSFSVAPTVDMTSISNSGQGTTTTGMDGLQIDFVTAAVGGTVTNAGIQLNVTSGATEAGDTLYGINIGNLTGQTGTEYALEIGTGWDRGLDINSPAQIGSTLTATGTTVIGSGADTFTFNPAGSGPVYAGTARPSKVMTLSPEYAGTTLTADGSGTTTGSMTSDNMLNVGGTGGWSNYYQWSSTEAALQDYTVMVRVTLPQDFDTWETGACPSSTCALEIYYQTGVGSTANNSFSAIINNNTDTPATAVCTIAAAQSTTWTSTGCTEAILNDAAAPEWDAAGETAVMRIKLAANSTASALSRVGDIILRYKAKF